MKLESLRIIILYFNYFMIYYVISINLFYFMQLIMSMFNLMDYIKKMRYSDFGKYTASENMIPISVLVPAFNEEKTINENIKSLLLLKYPQYEVIVINDGSTDATLESIIQAFNLKKVNQPVRCQLKTKEIRGIYRNIEIPNLILIDKENGGKADALNVGINVSRYPVFAAIDADSILEGHSLVRLIMPFVENSDTIAVGGIVRIANGSVIRDGIIERIELPENNVAMFQTVEYLRAFLSGRMGWDAFGTLLLISGAFGAFKKDEVLKVGGYTVGTIGEDMELVMKLHKSMIKSKKQYRIKFIPDPVCWTQVPEHISDLRKQRRRWQIGLIDSLFRHAEMMFNPRYRMVGLVAIPCYLLFEMVSPVVEILGYILIPVSFFIGILNIKFFLMFVIASILFGILLSIGAILLEQYTFNRYPSISQLMKLIWFGIAENFWYRQVTTVFKMEGIFKFKKQKHHWGSIERMKWHEQKNMTRGL